MSDRMEKHWSNNPYAPGISHLLYLEEKENFVGNLIGAILYGVVIVLFFQCMGALLNPADRTRAGVRWGLVAQTTAMFAALTVYTAINLNIHFNSYTDHREYTGIDDGMSGPLGYQFSIFSKPISVAPNAMFPLNQWLADGLLLYRCYIVHAMNFWVVAFPCLIYIASMAMGIVIVYRQVTEPFDNKINFGIPYFLISLVLNIFLTLLIVIRLVRHSRDLQGALGPLGKSNRLYKTIVTILVESSALYAVTFTLFIGPWGANDGAQFLFSLIIAQIQVISPLLIILRVAKHRVFTSSAPSSQEISAVHFASEGTSIGSAQPLDDEYTVSSVDAHGERHS